MTVFALASAGCTQSAATVGTYEQAVRCVELATKLVVAREQVEKVAAERGATIDPALIRKWSAQAKKRGADSNVPNEKIEDDLSHAMGRGMTAFSRPFSSAPDPEELTKAAPNIFDEAFVCNEQAKSFALPEEVMQ